ncbi:hypothetical protein EYF80_046959 [Liparis tanakae]|uniref:Uncharacterized protein n=1 Tax=Liparis tanakae TaxID=230148 RepID=A0A4Z2FNN2_9TELE|nr:hypothetical protein EYF80_046959 [Liparis tanakae]
MRVECSSRASEPLSPYLKWQKESIMAFLQHRHKPCFHYHMLPPLRPRTQEWLTVQEGAGKWEQIQQLEL